MKDGVGFVVLDLQWGRKQKRKHKQKMIWVVRAKIQLQAVFHFLNMVVPAERTARRRRAHLKSFSFCPIGESDTIWTRLTRPTSLMTSQFLQGPYICKHVFGGVGNVFYVYSRWFMLVVVFSGWLAWQRLGESLIMVVTFIYDFYCFIHFGFLQSGKD